MRDQRAARIALYVSEHGFGHATRQAALMEALVRRGSVSFLLRTEASISHFDAVAGTFRRVGGRFDAGLVQRSALTVDRPATLAAHRALLADFDETVARERALLIDFSPDVVVSDCGAAPMEAARALGIPALVVGNFSWDWILEGFAREDPRWSPIVERYARAYGAADAFWRLPFHADDPGAFKQIRDFPHLVRRPRLDRAQTLAALGLSPRESRPIVTVAFGGFETGAFTGARPDVPEDFLFVGFTPPPCGLESRWIRPAKLTQVRTVDIFRVSSAVIGKLGYGTAAECAVYGVRMLYVPRMGNREIPNIERTVRAYGGFRRLAAEDFFSVRWRGALGRLLEEPDPPFVPGDGADRIAQALGVHQEASR